VKSGPDLELEPPERVADRRGGENGAGGPVERCKEPVAGRVELRALEPGELAADDRVMPLEQFSPGESPSRDASSVEPTMSVKRTVASTRAEPARSVSRKTKRSVASIVAR
jgi:hypothetical protein